MAELKPCPFCGHKARLLTKQTQINDSIIFREFEYEYIVKCNKCRASMGYYKSAKAAEKAWNTRTPIDTATEVKHGEWIEETEYYDDEYSECNVRKVFACSLCGRTEKSKQPYCNCGAIMDGKDGVQE